MPDDPNWIYINTSINQYASPLLKQWACKKCGVTYTIAGYNPPAHCQHCYLEAQVKALGEATLG